MFESVDFLQQQKELEKLSRKFGKEKGVKFISRNNVTATDKHGDKYSFTNWTGAYEFISEYNPDKEEIFSPLCSFSSLGGENVSVKLSDCPIKREEWKHEYSPMFGEDKGKTLEMTRCIYHSDFDGSVVPRCEHYHGSKEVKRDERRRYKVLCTGCKSN